MCSYVQIKVAWKEFLSFDSDYRSVLAVTVCCSLVNTLPSIHCNVITGSLHICRLFAYSALYRRNTSSEVLSYIKCYMTNIMHIIWNNTYSEKNMIICFLDRQMSSMYGHVICFHVWFTCTVHSFWSNHVSLHFIAILTCIPNPARADSFKESCLPVLIDKEIKCLPLHLGKD